jgi:CPSF A subunit region
VALRYNDDADNDATKSDLDRVAQFNVGDCINRIRPGGLIMQLPEAEFAGCKTFIMGSILGMISLVVLLPKHRYEQLAALQTAMQGHVKVRPLASRVSSGAGRSCGDCSVRACAQIPAE